MRTSSVGQWLPIIEYSIKSGVSLSTIRRKIKANSIPFKLEKGKYLILLNQNELTSNAGDKLVNSSVPSAHTNKLLLQEERIRQLEQELNEMALLVQTLEKKYGVQY